MVIVTAIPLSHIHEIDLFIGFKRQYLLYCFYLIIVFRRIIHDVLEIIEQSLDITLAGNALRYRFVDTPILDGISIHETCANIIILVPTVCSVHRLVFPHPDRLHRQVNSKYL